MQSQEALKKLVDDYFAAFEARDLARCLSFFRDDAELVFATGRFPGIKAIEQWHKDRFKGGMRLVEIEDIEYKPDTVIVYAVVTSPRLKLVRIENLRGIGTFVFDQDKFRQVRMELRKGYSFHI
jgi:hypothetical protein